MDWRYPSICLLLLILPSDFFYFFFCSSEGHVLLALRDDADEKPFPTLPTYLSLSSHMFPSFHLNLIFRGTTSSCKFFSLGLFFRLKLFSSCHRPRVRFRSIFVQECDGQQHTRCCVNQHCEDNTTSLPPNDPNWLANDKRRRYSCRSRPYFRGYRTPALCFRPLARRLALEY